MTVSELITILQQLDQTLPVSIPSSDEFGQGLPVYAAGARVTRQDVYRQDGSTMREEDQDKNVVCVEVYS